MWSSGETMGPHGFDLAKNSSRLEAAASSAPCIVRRYVRRFAHGHQPRDRSRPPRTRPPGERGQEQDCRSDAGIDRVHRAARAGSAARSVRLAHLGPELRLQERAQAQMNLFVDTSVWSLALRRDTDSSAPE